MKKALGKGIKAFIPEEYGILKDEKYAEVEIELLRPNPLQPRMTFDEKAMEELARSIQEAGVLQPILCVPEEGYYKILTGERRWRAAQKAGLSRVPVLIRNIPEAQQLEISLIENLQREELNPIEIAHAYQRLIEDLKYTQQDVGDKVGKERSSVTNYLRLLKLPDEVQSSLKEGKISMGHARALLAVDIPEHQLKLCRKIIRKNLSVREVEKLVSGPKLSGDPPRKAKTDPNFQALQEDLLRFLGTKVDIVGNDKKGVIRIFYFSLDELNRVSELIKGVHL